MEKSVPSEGADGEGDKKVEEMLVEDTLHQRYHSNSHKTHQTDDYNGTRRQQPHFAWNTLELLKETKLRLKCVIDS
jgi:hypothetical protein